MKTKTLLVIFLLFIMPLSVFALDDEGNPNDPNINERANACYEDGSMAGKCDTAWEWDGGWYLIRFQYGLISRDDVPAQYHILLPALPPSNTSPPAPYVMPTAGCVFLAGMPISGVDIYTNFNGGNFQNAPSDYYFIADCTNVLSAAVTTPIVYAPNGIGDAIAICQSNGYTNANTLPTGYNPALYECV